MLGDHKKCDTTPCEKEDTDKRSDHVMSLVKLTRSGLVLLTFPGDKPPETVNIVADIFQSLDSGSLKSPL